MTEKPREPFWSGVIRLRWPRWAAITFCGVIGIFVPASYGMVMGVSEPVVHDEFAYLLGADTFARGRLTNPSPPHPEFFEAPHILVVPSYSSKYPPGQSLLLALGQVTTGRPIWGVWLSCGLFAASLCWMLQAWSSRQWALTITVLTIVTLGMSTYWAQSYWGGMAAASGSALVFGGMRRSLSGAPRMLPALLTAVGVLLLANTRPYEGALACVGFAVVMGRWLICGRRFSVSTKLKWALIPAGLVLIAGAMWAALYNRALTGDLTEAPYALHTEQYLHSGLFLFSPLREPQRTPPERIDRFYRQYETPPLGGASLIDRTQRNLVLRLFASLGTPFGIVLGSSPPQYHGVLLWLVLLISVWSARWTGSLLIITAIAAIGEYMLWSHYNSVYLPVLAGVVNTAWLTTFVITYRRNYWAPFIFSGVVMVVLGQSLIWWWWSHYSAPIVPLMLAAVATSVQRLARRSSAVHKLPRLGSPLIVLLAVHVVTLATVYALLPKPAEKPADGIIRSRSELIHRLQEQGGLHVVFVQYDEAFTVDYEWVYNAADLQTAQVVFAHDLGESRNSELLAEYGHRFPWIVRVSKHQIEFEPYLSAPRNGPGAHASR